MIPNPKCEIFNASVFYTAFGLDADTLLLNLEQETKIPLQTYEGLRELLSSPDALRRRLEEKEVRAGFREISQRAKLVKVALRRIGKETGNLGDYLTLIDRAYEGNLSEQEKEGLTTLMIALSDITTEQHNACLAAYY